MADRLSLGLCLGIEVGTYTCGCHIILPANGIKLMPLLLTCICQIFRTDTADNVLLVSVSLAISGFAATNKPNFDNKSQTRPLKILCHNRRPIHYPVLFNRSPLSERFRTKPLAQNGSISILNDRKRVLIAPSLHPQLQPHPRTRPRKRFIFFACPARSPGSITPSVGLIYESRRRKITSQRTYITASREYTVRIKKEENV